MGNPIVGNLLKSKATIWVAPYGEAIPDETTVAADAAWGGNWARMGFTKAPLKVTYEPTYADMSVEEHLAPVKRRKTSHKAMAETVLAEMTAEYLKLLSGGQGTITTTAAGAAQKGFEDYDVGDSPLLEEYAVGFEGIHYDAEGDPQPLRIFFPKATLRFTGEVEFSNKTEDYAGMGVVIEALADAADSGKLLRWQRVTAPATA